MKRPYYQKALEALQAAHDACLKAPDRDVLGMSYGPFSGVNVALGIISELEAERERLLFRCRHLERKKLRAAKKKGNER
jgi:hypothetical protein